MLLERIKTRLAKAIYILIIVYAKACYDSALYTIKQISLPRAPSLSRGSGLSRGAE